MNTKAIEACRAALVAMLRAGPTLCSWDIGGDDLCCDQSRIAQELRGAIKKCREALHKEPRIGPELTHLELALRNDPPVGG